MHRTSLRPYSRVGWLEKRRRWTVEQERRREWRRSAIMLLGGLVLAVVLTWVYVANPSNWKGHARQYGKQAADFAAEQTK